MVSFWQKLKKPIFALAPMEDVTDSVFRQIVANCGRPDVFFTEFTSCDGFCSKGREKVMNRLRFTEKERPIVAQIWGFQPANFFQTSQKLADLGFDGIDINMGCPQKSVLKQGAGGALIKNPLLAKEIILAVKEGAPKLAVSVKTRLGFTKIQTEKWIEFLMRQNLAALTIHGRTVANQFEVPANWEEIGQAVKLRNQLKVETIILGNGDVKSYQQGTELSKKYGIDGVMIGRGIFNNPWIFQKSVVSYQPLIQERWDLLFKHVKLFEQTWGKSKNFAILKKFFKIYINNFPGAFELRTKLMAVNSFEELASQVDGLRD